MLMLDTSVSTEFMEWHKYARYTILIGSSTRQPRSAAEWPIKEPRPFLMIRRLSTSSSE